MFPSAIRACARIRCSRGSRHRLVPKSQCTRSMESRSMPKLPAPSRRAIRKPMRQARPPQCCWWRPCPDSSSLLDCVSTPTQTTSTTHHHHTPDHTTTTQHQVVLGKIMECGDDVVFAAGSLLPSDHEEFRAKGYWDSFFEKRNTDAFEWYGEYESFKDILIPHMMPSEELLVVGCGNSRLRCRVPACLCPYQLNICTTVRICLKTSTHAPV